MSSCKEIMIYLKWLAESLCVIMISEPAVVSAKYIFKIVKKKKEDLGHLISQYAYSDILTTSLPCCRSRT
jgi:hypothetical protein